jgi:ubiquinol-cytochrome c reductase cytochrome b subunit
LPWDLNAYFASQVAINIAASVPFIGQPIYQFLADGTSLGTLTINRFFGLHVWLMPALLILLTVAHLMFFRHNGSAGPATDEDVRKLPQGRFWPNQMFMDAVASFAVFAVIVALAIFSPPALDQKADPTRLFTPYPAWYFLALYGLLRVAALFPHNIAPIANLFATVLIPGVLVTVLIVLPFIDRNPSRRIKRRPWIMGITAVSVIAAIGLSLYSQEMIVQEQASMLAMPQPPAAPVAVSGGSSSGGASSGGAAAPSGNGAQIFATNCSGCHGAAGGGTPGAFPPLAGNAYVVGDPKHVMHTVLYGLTGAISVKGATYNGQMPPWKGVLSNADIADVISYVRSSWGNSASKVTESEVAAIPK